MIFCIKYILINKNIAVLPLVIEELAFTLFCFTQRPVPGAKPQSDSDSAFARLPAGTGQNGRVRNKNQLLKHLTKINQPRSL
jgi:hypothetical protein